jgi:hypothetical protein
MRKPEEVTNGQNAELVVAKVDRVETGEKSVNRVASRWRVQKGRRRRRAEKVEATWFQNFGACTPCTICALDHQALELLQEEDGKKNYNFRCPIAKREKWPPEETGISLWESSEPSPEKFARLHHYNTEDIKNMLEVWETSVLSLVIPMTECQEFRAEVLRITDQVRQSWMFKRSSIYYPATENGYDSNEEGDSPLRCSS